MILRFYKNLFIFRSYVVIFTFLSSSHFISISSNLMFEKEITKSHIIRFHREQFISNIIDSRLSNTNYLLKIKFDYDKYIFNFLSEYCSNMHEETIISPLMLSELNIFSNIYFQCFSIGFVNRIKWYNKLNDKTSNYFRIVFMN